MNPGYKFEEYPKALYRNGEYATVEDQREERARRREGFTDWPADQDKIAKGAFADGGGMQGDGQAEQDTSEQAEGPQAGADQSGSDQGAAAQTADLLSQ